MLPASICFATETHTAIQCLKIGRVLADSEWKGGRQAYSVAVGSGGFETSMDLFEAEK